MFKLNPNPTFQVQVPLSVPGLPEPLHVAMTFRHKNKASLRAWMIDGQGKDDAALLHELIVSWTGLQDDAGLDVPYSLTALNDLIGGYWAARDEITKAYLVELKESKTKNS
ncbi:MAG: hypothetical protein Q7K57_57175 [Burkholderiaceae bacterium]|nr:hypothetical protein [Burkholderiaceae bacterium]